MDKFFTLFLIGLVISASCQTIEQQAAEIHDKVFTIDSHTDTPLKFFNSDFNIGVEHDGRKGQGKIDIPRMEKGGLDAVFFAVFIGQGERDSLGHAQAFEKAEQIFEATHSEVKKNKKKAKIAITPEDGYQLEKKGKRAIYLGIENGYPIGNNLDNINHFYDLGARYITIVHSHNNDISDSSTDKEGPEYNGLSAFGEGVVERMNELGIMIDVSHASDSAFYDVLELSSKPVIASHSCARALCDNPRNLSDDMLKAIAENGGVIQMCILSDYVKKLEQSPERIEGKKAFRKKHSNWSNYTEEERKAGLRDWYQLDVDFPPNLATVSDAVDHIDHIVEVAGIDHVGIGTDFDGGGGLQDCYDASELGNITLELVKRGYSEEDIRKIWGGNFMRVFREVAAK
ncbi:membrane dipeptidase [Lentimicrobium sp. L6]|uniref:dipeptidase n=1 Tax=Lentimicrobium sp. L6 TaxID=2735916 RepID=UPI0015561905|nr:dipeptidase [Lentimicrobium sp. L6]NPD86880.1 membrane dipeptidase [Lentimicrobium sp. L6]